jgi:flagellar FliJ protein
MRSMKFRYAFQQIVDLKNTERTQAEWVLSEAIGKLQSEQSSLAELEGEKERVQEELAATSANAMTISQIRVMQQYVNHLNRQISLKASDVQRAKRHVEQKQQVLTDKMLDEKVWAKARQKAFEAHAALTLKREQQELDEIASVRFLRSSY